ncbi:Spy/CpxP family protein refolding chaperone [Hydrogenophaga electricum]|uniref:LTXXQ motif family protein n=1 Tax=Hydrogenophaga electricum TaxID=1230953 RepID=A0ABQ6C8Y2_9BURK|nr:Spy/CpxP family protein refolding chaperone [Hydrogenophaga electricum]GLS14736.1 hypothetical protein GCM10007935_21680 [Hydrogenophaga electricum]
MQPTLTRSFIATVLATTIAGLSATAIAQGAATQPPATPVPQAAQASPDAKPAQPRREARHAQRGERLQKMEKMRAEHQAKLKAELKLAPEQEAAWAAFVARTTPQRPAQPPEAPQDWAKLTTPERLDRMTALKAERDAAFTQRIDATRSFYGQLTAEQKQVFDQQARPFHQAGFKGHGPQHRQGRHPGHPGEGPAPMPAPRS